MVLKFPSSFSRGVKKGDNPAEERKIADEWFEDTDLLLAQNFIPTGFDWRVGVLAASRFCLSVHDGARPLADRQAPPDGGKPMEGGPQHWRSARRRPAWLIASGSAPRSSSAKASMASTSRRRPVGFFVVEVNDNPNIEHGVEDQAEKDQVCDSCPQVVQ